MKYDIRQLVLDDAYVQSGAFSGNTLELTLQGAAAEKGRERFSYERIRLVIEGFSLASAEIMPRRALSVNNTVKQIKGRRLYKSELEEFTARLTGEEWDIISFEVSGEGRVTAVFRVCFSDGGYFSFTVRCSEIYACGGSGEKKLGSRVKKTGFLEKFSNIFSGKNK